MSPIDDPYEVKYIRQILEANKSRTFVDRILNKNRYPVLDLGNGNIATHKMAWAKAGDKYVVHPTVLWDGKALKEYDPREAWNQVRKTGNYITFDSPQEAEWFSQNYKKVWEK